MQQDYRDRIAAGIARSRAFIQYVFPPHEGDGKAFAYTIGLTNQNLPELLIVGLDLNTSSHVLRKAIDELLEVKASGQSISDGFVGKKVLEGYDAIFRELPIEIASSKYALLANSYYGKDVPVMQVVFPDEEGRFPWNPQCSRHLAAGQSMVIDFTKEG